MNFRLSKHLASTPSKIGAPFCTNISCYRLPVARYIYIYIYICIRSFKQLHPSTTQLPFFGGHDDSICTNSRPGFSWGKCVWSSRGFPLNIPLTLDYLYPEFHLFSMYIYVYIYIYHISNIPLEVPYIYI